MSMGITVEDFKYIRGVNDSEYIELLKNAYESQRYITSKAIAKLKEQPEIIRCYECVHASDIVPIPNPNLRHCDKYGFFKTKDYFCGDAERITNGA